MKRKTGDGNGDNSVGGESNKHVKIETFERTGEPKIVHQSDKSYGIRISYTRKSYSPSIRIMVTGYISEQEALYDSALLRNCLEYNGLNKQGKPKDWIPIQERPVLVMMVAIVVRQLMLQQQFKIKIEPLVAIICPHLTVRLQ